MHPTVFLQDLAYVLGIAAVTTVVFQRLRQPVVLGYLLAGLIVGPHLEFSPVADAETIRELSELGVILLMFSLGLEFSLRRIVRLGGTVALVAAVEIGLMLTLGYLTAQLLGWSSFDSLVGAFLVAISSTMIIARAFQDRKVEGRLAELVFGVLIMEDLVAILLIAALAAIAGGNGLDAATLGRVGLRLLAFLAGMMALGLLVVPRLMRTIVRLRRPETTLVASVGLSFAAALLAQQAGYSVALGAFLAGSLVAESGTAHQVEALVRPVRDMFAAIFFVAVGMLIDPAMFLEYWPAIAAFTAVVLVGKVTGVSIGAFIAGNGVRTSVRAGMSMAQIGEFSFIIAALAMQLGAASEFLYPVAVAVSVLTAYLTPWMIRGAEPLALYVDRRLPRAIQTFVSLYGSWIEQLRSGRQPVARERRWVRLLALDAVLLAGLIIGVAVNRDRLVEVLRELLPLDPDAARTVVLLVAAAAALPFAIGIVGLARRLGQAMAERILPPAARGVDYALAPRRALMVTLQIAVVLVVGLPMVAVTQPFLPPYRGPAVVLAIVLVLGVAFWRSATNLQGHMRAGAQLIVEALAPSRKGPRDAYGELHRLEEVQHLLPGLGTLVPVRVGSADGCANQSLASLNLRGRTGATAVALLRGDERIVFPTAREILRPGDVLALSGSREAIQAATALLHSPAERPEPTPTPA